MKKKIISWILKAPLILLVITSFIASVYLAYSKLYGIGWSTPITIAIILILYIIGIVIEKRKKTDF